MPFNHLHWDFAFLDMGPVDMEMAFPYEGPRLYCKEEIEYLWDNMLILREDHFRIGIRASYHVATEDVAKAFAAMDHVWDQLREPSLSPKYIADIKKRSLLMMLGVWSSQHQFAWKEYHTTHDTDAVSYTHLTLPTIYSV